MTAPAVWNLFEEVAGEHFPSLVSISSEWGKHATPTEFEISAVLQDSSRSGGEDEFTYSSGSLEQTVDSFLKDWLGRSFDPESVLQLAMKARSTAGYLTFIIGAPRRRGEVQFTVGTRPRHELPSVEQMFESSDLSDALLHLFRRSAESFDTTIGGFVHPGEAMYATPEWTLSRLGPGHVKGYTWMLALTQTSLDKLGGLSAVEDGPADVLETTDRDGSLLAVCRLAPRLVDAISATRLRAWRELLQPCLPEKWDLAGHSSVHKWARPPLLLEEDWRNRGEGLSPWP